MSVAHIYNEFVSDHFDRDPFQIYQDSRERALGQIRRHKRATTESILDLGLGTGDLLLALHDLFPRAALSGIDASQKMIGAAMAKFEGSRKDAISIFHGDVHHMGRHAGANSVDLLTMHFLMNYIDPQKVLSEAHGVLKPGGLFSITTGTEESFAALRVPASHIWSEEIIRAETRTTENAESLKQLLTDTGFRIVDDEMLIKEITFEDLKSLKDFIFHAGWCASKFLFDLSDEQIKMYEELAQAFLPIHDAMKICIVLAEKT